MIARALFMIAVFSIGPAVFGHSDAHAALAPMTLSSEDSFPSPRWMFGVGSVPTGDSGPALLAQAKRAQMDGDADACVKKIDLAWSKMKSVQPWMAVVEIECGVKLKNGADRVTAALNRVEKNPSWLITGAQVDVLRAAVLKGYVSTLEQDLKTNRARAARTIDRFEELSVYADDPLRAKIWRLAGELAFQSQNSEAAREFMRRSLSEADSDEARIRLAQIESTLDDDVSVRAPESKVTPNPQLEVSKEELELVDRATTALKGGDLVSAVDDAVKLIRSFPGSSRAKWASDRVLEAYSSVAEKSDAKYVLTRGQMIKLMQAADSDRVAEWGKAMFSRGQWDDSLTLLNAALDGIVGTRATAVLELAGRAAIATDRFELARKFFDRLIGENAGTPAAREALLRSGLLRFRMKDYVRAASDFERLLLFPGIERFEVTARYWFWRSLQRSSDGRADAAADELLRKFPFSYYGLRARMDRAANVLEWKPEPGKVSTKIWLTAGERRAWDRALLLLRAGWLDEAQAELHELPTVTKAEDKAVRALIWAAAGQYVTASKLANEAWDEVPSLRRGSLVAAAFPIEFPTFIDAQAASRKLDRYLLRSLIKQESGFNARAVSNANALGLMQLVPGTAKEVAGELRLGTLNLPDDLFQAARNIQMGTYYLSKLITKFSGHVPLALASYNAGPTRIDRWVRSRPSLANIAKSRSSNPDDELWFDEIPYAETSIYVKSILRNILIYKMLDKGRVQIQDPVWAETSQ